MTQPTYQNYNLPGFGFVRIRLFPHAKSVFDFLEQYDHISHLTTLDQLGPIRQVLPGAHHTRYEYLMAQLAIITELCHLTGQLPTGLSLTKYRTTFGTIPEITRPPSNGEILMVLALLGNIGHLPTTFCGERALMKYLRNNKNVRAAFRSGLANEHRPGFDQVLSNNQLHRFNYYIALFLLNRYKRASFGPSIVSFCQNILHSYLTTPSDHPDQALVALWNLYRSIRRVTYLALDSHYAPVPFTLDLSSIFFSLEHFLTDVFYQDSSFQNALGRLEGVLRDTVYLGPEQLINHAHVSTSVLSRLENMDSRPVRVREIWQLLSPTGSVSEYFSAPSGRKAQTPSVRPITQLCYNLDPILAPKVLPDPIAWERSARECVGLRSCSFAAEFDPPQTHLKVSAALSPGLDRKTTKKAGLRATKQLVDFENSLANIGVSFSPSTLADNGLALIRFALGALLSTNYEFRLRIMPVVDQPPICRTYGSTRASEHIDKYLSWAKTSGFFDGDRINEVKQLSHALRSIRYRGAVLSFAGSTEVINGGKVVAEFDGIAILLSRDIGQPVAIFVEAKNMANGQTAASRDLRDKFDRLSIPTENYTIEHLGTKGAYATLT